MTFKPDAATIAQLEAKRNEKENADALRAKALNRYQESLESKTDYYQERYKIQAHRVKLWKAYAGAVFFTAALLFYRLASDC